MKSKTLRTSKSTLTKDNSSEDPPRGLAIGHQPAVDPEKRFLAFQSNLLSLLSHELKTPLMGILNALYALEEKVELSPENSEWMKMARSNAMRLQHALSSLLDLASLESGTFQVRLREVDFWRLAKHRIDSYTSSLNDRSLSVVWDSEVSTESVELILADPLKLGQALDFLFQVILHRALPGSQLRIKLSARALQIGISLTPEAQQSWDEEWSHAWISVQGGMTSPASAFFGVLQDEQKFLNRGHDGLGTELVLIHEVLRLHQGTFKAHQDSSQLLLELELPEVASEGSLEKVLHSRIDQLAPEMGFLALVLFQAPEGMDPFVLRDQVKRHLFRPSDAVYPLPEQGCVALVLDHCKPEDVPDLVFRIVNGLGQKHSFKLKSGVGCFPSDGVEPRSLIEKALLEISQL